MKSLFFPLFRMPKVFFLRTEMDRLLASSMFFGCMMVTIRICHTGRLVFIFMIWNLFLAYIPYALSNWLTARCHADGTSLSTPLPPGARRRGMRGFLSIGIALVWLLFIPNSFYILTDIYHLADHYRSSKVPEWFDLILILSFAWNGLLLGILSVRQMERLIVPMGAVLGGWLFVYPIMLLNALGVYVGRYWRYNSWDIISDPVELLTDITNLVIHPFRNHPAWNMIFCFSILLTLFYRMMRGGSKALA